MPFSDSTTSTTTFRVYQANVKAIYRFVIPNWRDRDVARVQRLMVAVSRDPNLEALAVTEQAHEPTTLFTLRMKGVQLPAVAELAEALWPYLEAMHRQSSRAAVFDPSPMVVTSPLIRLGPLPIPTAFERLGED